MLSCTGSTPRFTHPRNSSLYTNLYGGDILVQRQQSTFSRMTNLGSKQATHLDKSPRLTANRTNHVHPPPTPRLSPYHPQILRLPDHQQTPSSPSLPILPALLRGLVLRNSPISIVRMILPMSIVDRRRLWDPSFYLLCLLISSSLTIPEIHIGIEGGAGEA